MKSRINRAAVLGFSMAFGMVSMLPGASLAESQCKGMEKQACGRNTDCAWVDGYKRKDGKQVSSYCRSTSKKSAPTSSTKKEETEKSSNKKKDEKK